MASASSTCKSKPWLDMHADALMFRPFIVVCMGPTHRRPLPMCLPQHRQAPWLLDGSGSDWRLAHRGTQVNSRVLYIDQWYQRATAFLPHRVALNDAHAHLAMHNPGFVAPVMRLRDTSGGRGGGGSGVAAMPRGARGGQQASASAAAAPPVAAFEGPIPVSVPAKASEKVVEGESCEIELTYRSLHSGMHDIMQASSSQLVHQTLLHSSRSLSLLPLSL